MERFVFDVSNFPELTLDTTNMVLASDGNEGQPGTGLGRDMEEQFRAALVKLVMSIQKLGKLPKNCSFSLAIELKDDTLPLDGVSRTFFFFSFHSMSMISEDGVDA